jgi:hypothetical protein
MPRFACGAWLVAGAFLMVVACGKVSDKPPVDGPPGGDGGGACTASDQCAAPTPVCDTAGGTCVECVQSDQCPAERPRCDTATHTCGACLVDADCASDVCEADGGTCVDEANVLYTSPTGPDAGTCPKNSPCSLVQAVALAAPPRIAIKLAPGTYSAHVILSNKTLEFFGVGATINALGTGAAFEVQDGGHLRIAGATVTAATTVTAIRCEGAGATTALFRVTVQNTSTTMIANPCTLSVVQSVLRNTSAVDFQILIVGPSVATFDRTRFVGNGTGGLGGLSNADIQITNSLFTKVGKPGDHGAFVGGAYNVQFSTVVDGIVECGTAGASALTMNSSIVRNTIGTGDTLLGINACTSVKNSVVFPNAAPLGATNLIVDPQLKNIAADDFHLLVTSPALDHGDPASTLDIDFDGTPRPQGAGRDSGALEFKP